MPLEIKANNWYRTRGGEIAYVFGINPYAKPLHESVHGTVKDGWLISWFFNGRYVTSDTDELDLIEHLPDCDGFDWVPKPKIKLEAGKRYVLANGHTVGPMVLHSVPTHMQKYYSQGNVGRMWFEDGGRVALSDRPHENIVSEYIEPEPVYEPFANAAEFEPHRDRWIQRVSGGGCFNCVSYSDIGIVYGVDERSKTYKELFNFRFDDNTPCGKRVQP